MKNKGLGRGLEAIFEAGGGNLTGFGEDNPLMKDLDITLVIPNPGQPRTTFDENTLEELADSIRSLGVIQPITVKSERNGKYIIISGERRWRASQLAGLERIPAYIREVDDQTLHEMSLVENIQRQDLNPMEIALGIQRLMEECGVTQDTVAARVGKKRSTVANYLRLLGLSPEVQLALKQDIITMGHAKAIASADENLRSSVLKKILKKGLSVRQTEELVKKLGEEKPSKAEAEEDDILPDTYTRLTELIAKVFSEDIRIKKNRTGGGKITIGFSSDEEIEAILSNLEKMK